MARLRGHAKIATPVSAKSQRAVWLLLLTFVPCFIGVEGTEITAQAITTTPHGDIDIVFTE
jgi:hypothetical protein